MKYAILVIVSAFCGFVAAWGLFRAITGSDADVMTRQLASMTSPRAVFGHAAPAPASRASASAAGEPGFSDIEKADKVFDQLYLAWQVAARSDVPKVRSLIEKCLDRTDPLYTENIAAIFLERYTELDPAGAMQFVTHEYRLDQATFQGDVLTSWVRYDPQAAIDYFKQITDQNIRYRVGARLLADPTLAQAGLTDQVKQILGPYADIIQKRLKMSRTDPVDLFRQSLLLTGEDRRTQMIQAVNRWAARDPEAALARIGTLSDPEERDLMLRIAVHRYSQRDPKAALAWLQTNQPGNTNLQREVLTQLAMQNIDAALPLVEDFVRRTGQTQALDNIVGIWARSDPERAINYVDSLDSDNKSTLYRTLAFSYIRHDPVAGLNWIVSLGPEYKDIKKTMITQISNANVSAAQEALRNTSDSTTRTALIEGIARYKARTDPQSALDWLDDYTGDNGYMPAYDNVLSRYAQQHPEQAAQLLDSSLTGTLITKTASRVADAWYRKDPKGATDWAISLPPSDARIGAITSVVEAVAGKDPQHALDLSQSLPPDVRRRLAASIGYSWVSQYPDQVEQIISKLNATPAVASQLRRLASHSQ